MLRSIALLATAAVLVFPAAATAALAQEEKQGQGLAESVRSGEKPCSELAADDFELIGEFAMGQYLGSTDAHAAMNRRMTQMTGESGERRMHMALGYHYTRCQGGPASSWMGLMAGMMYGDYGPGMMGGNQGGYSGSMMGDNWSGRQGDYRGSMMGDDWHHDDDIAAWGVILIAFAAALLGGGVVALVIHLRGSLMPAPPGDF